MRRRRRRSSLPPTPTEVWRLVEASVAKLQGKAARPDREDGPMKATLNYLKGWAF